MHRTVDEALAVVGNEVVLRLTLLELSQCPLGHLDVAVGADVRLHSDVAVCDVASPEVFERRDLVGVSSFSVQ